MSPGDSTLLFDHSSRLVRRKELRTFLRQIAERVAGRGGITCLITTDSELRRLNKQFRGKDYATDVLSFPPDDIAVSLDRAAEQAAEHGHGLAEELRILMLHGMLHLSGMDHETDSGRMRRAETRWRKEFGLPSGLIERASA
jgi:probable rRNA maturation factor